MVLKGDNWHQRLDPIARQSVGEKSNRIVHDAGSSRVQKESDKKTNDEVQCVGHRGDMRPLPPPPSHPHPRTPSSPPPLHHNSPGGPRTGSFFWWSHRRSAHESQTPNDPNITHFAKSSFVAIVTASASEVSYQQHNSLMNTGQA